MSINEDKCITFNNNFTDGLGKQIRFSNKFPVMGKQKIMKVINL